MHNQFEYKTKIEKKNKKLDDDNATDFYHIHENVLRPAHLSAPLLFENPQKETMAPKKTSHVSQSPIPIGGHSENSKN